MSFATASSLLELDPVALIGGAVGMAKIKRAKNEKAPESRDWLLAERGHTVAGRTEAGKAPKVVASHAPATTKKPVTP